MPSPLSRSRIVLLTLLSIAAAATAFADPVEGHFQHRGETLQLSHGLAVSWPDPDAVDGRRIGVLLADAEPEASHGVGKDDPLAAIGNRLPFGSGHLSLVLQGPEQALTVQQLFFLPTGLNATGSGVEQLQLRDGRLIGEWTIPETRVFDASYQGRLRFDLPVVALDALAEAD